ncbi:MAG: Matrixin [Pseudomonadota bacterium]|jgi:hypothetical protein
MKTVFSFFFVILFFLSSQSAEAFVFLGPHKPRLKPTDGRIVKFALTNEAPAFVDKDEYADGYFAQLSDSETFELLVAESMRIWNEVPQLAIELAIDSNATGFIDPDDGVFSIGIGNLDTQASGLAYPVENIADPTEIRDCDIQVAQDVVSIPSFVFVMVHELGHCLGLGHNHSDPTAIMGYWQPANEIALGSDDVAGILSLYPPATSAQLDTFAPCGSIAQPASREAGSQGLWRSYGFAYFLLLLPIGMLGLRRVFMTWSCRHRRQTSVP